VVPIGAGYGTGRLVRLLGPHMYISAMNDPGGTGVKYQAGAGRVDLHVKFKPRIGADGDRIWGGAARVPWPTGCGAFVRVASDCLALSRIGSKHGPPPAGPLDR
jgi:hypothetical protein